jgi:hypothetical protein
MSFKQRTAVPAAICALLVLALLAPSVATAKRPSGPAPTATPTPTGAKATTRPAGSAVLGDAEAAARVRRSSWEPRPGNVQANQRRPTSTEIGTFLTKSGSWGTCGERLRTRVTGNFSGTTDEILQWAAHKWGFDEDIARAQAVKESWWYMSAVGDGGVSFGMMQIKSTFHPGTAPLAAQSTAFTLDYWGAVMRNHYDGCSTGSTPSSVAASTSPETSGARSAPGTPGAGTPVRRRRTSPP